MHPTEDESQQGLLRFLRDRQDLCANMSHRIYLLIGSRKSARPGQPPGGSRGSGAQPPAPPAPWSSRLSNYTISQYKPRRSRPHSGTHRVHISQLLLDQLCWEDRELLALCVLLLLRRGPRD